MINTQNLITFPVFGDNSTKTAPDSAKASSGFIQADVLPAEWVNWEWYHASKGITDLNTGVRMMEQELNAIVAAGGATPDGTSAQVLAGIQYVITQKTGALADLTTTNKTTIVAACNEILSALNTHKADTNNPHQVAGSQLVGTVPADKIGAGSITQTKVANDAWSYGRVVYGICDTPEGTQAKTVSIPNLAVTGVVPGLSIRVTFTNGSTFGLEGELPAWGQCPGLAGNTTTVYASDNKIAKASAPTLSITCNDGESAAYPIKVESEYAGEGFVEAGATHILTLVADGQSYAWSDETATNIYCNKVRNYSKKRDGLIEQFGYSTTSTYGQIVTETFPIKYSSFVSVQANASNDRNLGGCETNIYDVTNDSFKWSYNNRLQNTVPNLCWWSSKGY